MTVLISCQSDWKTIFHGSNDYDVLVCFPIIYKGEDSIMVYKSIGGLYLPKTFNLYLTMIFALNYTNILKKKNVLKLILPYILLLVLTIALMLILPYYNYIINVV